MKPGITKLLIKKDDIKNELNALTGNIKQLDFKVTFILISIALIEFISYYYTSRRFFRFNLFDYFVDNENVYFIEYAYWLISEFLSQFVIPILLILFILKDKPGNYGIRFGDKKLGFSLSFAIIIIMLPILWIVTGYGSFQEAYPQCQYVRDSWNLFFIYEFFFLLYMIGWEFIWRGYMLFGLKEKFGNYAILLQMIPFTILHNGKPQLETLGAIIAGLALGILAFRTRSFIYGVIIHTSVMFIIDTISVLRYKTQIFGIGIDSLIEIFKKI
jgi:membrane protease YdiL (CAAX protease family)